MNKILNRGISLSVSLIFLNIQASFALPPTNDIPEEVLRSEIITEARSPINNEPLTAADYAELRAQLAKSPYPPNLDPKLQQLIFLLRIRQLLQTISPF